MVKLSDSSFLDKTQQDIRDIAQNLKQERQKLDNVSRICPRKIKQLRSRLARMEKRRLPQEDPRSKYDPSKHRNGLLPRTLERLTNLVIGYSWGRNKTTDATKAR